MEELESWGIGMGETKGILLISIVADVLRLEKEGRISREDLDEEICPEALKVLETGVSPIGWYSDLIYRDLARVLMRVEGRGAGDMEYLRQRGARAAQRLLESGTYQQLEYLKRQVGSRTGPVSKESFAQALRLIVSMPAGFMKGGRWTVAQDPDYPDRVQIVVDGVDNLPEENAQATCGLLTGISFHGGSRFSFAFERHGKDRIVYKMDRDISTIRYGKDD
jgi:hypothetical protein